MRIAVLFHANHQRHEVESEYAIGILAELWRQEGHQVRFLIGQGGGWAADVAILHIDLSVVPDAYVAFAAREYPIVLNARATDIRKSTISQNLIDPDSAYQGPIIVKTDLNSAGIPERRYQARQRRDEAEQSVDCEKRYVVYDSVELVPREVRSRRGTVIEKFLPEIEDGWYIKRECFVLGDRAISYRMRGSNPIVEGGVAFDWIENDPKVIETCRKIGLDYGVVDYTVHDGETVILDINKTVGIGRLQAAERRDYERLVQHLAPGIYAFSPVAMVPAEISSPDGSRMREGALPDFA